MPGIRRIRRGLRSPGHCSAKTLVALAIALPAAGQLPSLGASPAAIPVDSRPSVVGPALIHRGAAARSWGGLGATGALTITPTVGPGVSDCPVESYKAAEPSELLLGERTRISMSATLMCPDHMDGLHLVLVLDASGSMAGASARALERSASQLVRDLNVEQSPATQVGVVAFNSTARVLSELSNDEESLIAAIQQIGAGGGTSVKSGIEAGLQVLSRGRTPSPGKVTHEVMVVLADGGDNRGCPPVLESADRAKGEGVVLYALALGPGCDRDCMRQVATSEEYYYELDTAGELEQIIEPLLSESGLLTIRWLTIADHLPPSMHLVPLSAVPEPESISPANDRLLWRFDFVPPGGVEVGFEVEPQKKGYQHTNARAEGVFEDAFGRSGRFVFPMPRVRVVVPSPTPTITPSPEPTPVPTATPTPEPTPVPSCVCEVVKSRVPSVVVADALANPARYYGWQYLLNPGVPPGPGNPPRECLSLANVSLDYHPLWNKPMWRVGCP